MKLIIRNTDSVSIFYCVRSFVFQVIVVTVLAQLSVETTGYISVVHISVKQRATVLDPVGIKSCSSSEWVSAVRYCPTPGWLDSNDVCMSEGSWACGGGATKWRGHRGHSTWGNSSHRLTVGPPPLYPHTYVMSGISNCLVTSTNFSILEALLQLTK